MQKSKSTHYGVEPPENEAFTISFTFEEPLSQKELEEEVILRRQTSK